MADSDLQRAEASLLTRALEAAARPVKANATIHGMPHWRTWRATFYCDRGRTASGAWVGPGMIASGSELPFGTVVQLPGWGPVQVQDRGGVIWNGRIDIWVPSCSQARALGVQYIGGWYVDRE